MSQPDVLANNVSVTSARPASHKRKLADTLWQPFAQYKLLTLMLGTTVIVAFALGIFLYLAFSNMIGIIDSQGNSNNYYGDMIGTQLINIFRYCGALFTLYVIFLAAVCITYTHRVAGPISPFTRHIDALNTGNYAHRVTLRKNDLPLYNEHADKLNALAITLETQQANPKPTS